MNREADGVEVTQALIASFALTFVAEGAAALSSLALLHGMNPERRFRRFMLGVSIVVTAWALAGTIRFAVASAPVATLEVCRNYSRVSGKG